MTETYTMLLISYLYQQREHSALHWFKPTDAAGWLTLVRCQAGLASQIITFPAILRWYAA